MADQGKNGPLPAWEVYDHPIYGKVARSNFALNHPAEEEIRHRGQFVAWSMDGSKILASGATMGELFDEIHRLNLGGDDCVIARVPDDV